MPGPFTLGDARRSGLDRWHLTGSSWRTIGPATFASAQVADSPELMLAAARLRLPAGVAFSGLTAAWLHGLDVEPCDPIEVIAPPSVGISGRAGMRLRRCELAKEDAVKVRDFCATSISRTIRDLCLRLSLTEAVVIADMALHARLISGSSLSLSVDRSSGQQGVRQLRRVLEFAEPKAESPMESRLRMLLVLGGLPRPEAQVDVRDGWQRFIGRPDLCYRSARLGLDYDGAIHRVTLAEDNRRQNRLLEAWVRLLRFTAADIYNGQEVILSQVRNALMA